MVLKLHCELFSLKNLELRMSSSEITFFLNLLNDDSDVVHAFN